MSTRSTTHFMSDDRTEAIIYRHTDGYPDGHGKELQTFFQEIEAATNDHRYDDPPYLAAKLVVWLAERFAYTHDSEFNRVKADRLDFLSVGIVMNDPDDIEYRYRVNCAQRDSEGRPVVTCETYAGEPVEIPVAA